MTLMDDVCNHLADQFSCGTMSIHVDDEMSDGRSLADAMAEAMAAPELDGEMPIRQALQTIMDVWGSGFELASGDDLANDDETVSEIVFAHVDPGPTIAAQH